jgi:hypothetical protein
MPKEYFMKWFRDITICIPNYKKYFPKVYNSKILYETINNFYGYNSNQNFFDISQGNILIKKNIISKKKFEDTGKKLYKIMAQNLLIYMIIVCFPLFGDVKIK